MKAGSSRAAKPSPLTNLTRQTGVFAVFLHDLEGECVDIQASSRFPAALCRGLASVVARICREFEDKENAFELLHLEFHEVAVISARFNRHVVTLLADPSVNLRFLSNGVRLVAAHLEANGELLARLESEAAAAPKARGRRAEKNSRNEVPAEFFAQLREILVTHAGPASGRNLLHRALREMEFTETSLPRKKVGELLGAISVRIAYRSRRRIFLSEAMQMARGLGINPGMVKEEKTES